MDQPSDCLLMDALVERNGHLRRAAAYGRSLADRTTADYAEAMRKVNANVEAIQTLPDKGAAWAARMAGCEPPPFDSDALARFINNPLRLPIKDKP